MIITAGQFKGQKITAPDENITRPTLSKVRMSVFNTLQAVMSYENKTFLDMFAGSGIMGLEALSRGFESVVAYEKNPKVASVLKKNAEFLKKYNKSADYKLFVGDGLKLPAKINQNFDCIYIDPPYFSGVYEESLKVIKDFACGVVILEHVTDVDFVGFSVIKQKKYGDKFLTFLQKDC